MSEKSNSPGNRSAHGPGRLPWEERVLESRDLLEGTQQVLIRHEGRLYCLRRTRLGKLILTA